MNISSNNAPNTSQFLVPESLPLRTTSPVLHFMSVVFVTFFFTACIAASLHASEALSLFRTVSAQEITKTQSLQASSNLASKHFSQFSVLEMNTSSFQAMTGRKTTERKIETFEMELLLGKKAKTPVHISLQPYNPFAPNASLVAKTPNGDEQIQLEEEFAIYRGTVEGDKTSHVFCSISKSGVQMTIHTKGETWTIEPLPANETTTLSQQTNGTPSIYVLYSAAERKEYQKFHCDAEEFGEDNSERSNEHDNEHVSESQHSTVQNNKNAAQNHALRVCEMGIMIDYATYQSLGSSQAQSAQYAAAVIAAVSQIYERDVQVQLTVSHVEVWTRPDPTASATNTMQLLSQFRLPWLANNTSINRDLAHLLTVRLGGGIAYLNALCSQPFAYGVSAGLRTTFPIDPGWTTIVVAHEIGHNFGSWHTHSCNWAGGAIDRCAPAEDVPSGQTPCFTGTVRSRGTIMSYCYSYPGGSSNIDISFHPLCAQRMISRAQAASCLGTSNGGGSGGGGWSSYGCTTNILFHTDRCRSRCKRRH